MSGTRGRLLWIAVLGCGVLLVVVLGLAQLRQAEAELAQAITATETAVAQIGELQRLRATQADLTTRRRPDEDLIAQLRDALKTQGLPVAALAGIKPQGDRATAQAGLRLQTVRVQLQGLQPLELGRFLDAWRRAGTGWIVTELQLQHEQGGRVPVDRRRRGQAVDDNRYQAMVLLAAPYVGRPAAGPAGG